MHRIISLIFIIYSFITLLNEISINGDPFCFKINPIKGKGEYIWGENSMRCIAKGLVLFFIIGLPGGMIAKSAILRGISSAKLREVDSFNTGHNSRISFLQDKESGKKFLLKQERRPDLHWHIAVAREALGAHVAHSVNIPANQVEIVPAHVPFPAKRVVEKPATLHTVVPGVKINRAKKLRPLRICIQQYIKDRVPKSQWGLSRDVVRSMALHKDLARLAALDTFIANGDRHRGNFFYDEKTDRFFAIDLESSFKKDLAHFGAKFISTLSRSKTRQAQLSAQELEGLCIYRDTLKRLLSKHTPSGTYQKLLAFAIKAGILPRVGRGAVGVRVNGYKTSIEKNYASCRKLILLLDHFIANKSKQQESVRKKGQSKAC
jgi:hypothetical protein